MPSMNPLYLHMMPEVELLEEAKTSLWERHFSEVIPGPYLHYLGIVSRISILRYTLYIVTIKTKQACQVKAWECFYIQVPL